MRKVMQIFRIRKIGSLLLVLLALVAIFPVFFSVTGSLMGQKELNDLLGAVLTADSGSASGQTVSYVFWRVLPLYPTLRSYVKVLLDSPEFFVMFWNSVKITVGVLAGQILVGVPAAWGFARYRFPGKNLLFMIYVALMMMPFQVMMLSNYLVLDQMKLLDHLWGIILPAAFSTFPVFIMYRFFESIPEALMGQKELNDLLGAVLTADSGSASGQTVSYVFWRVLPLYPTLRSYVKVLLDSPEFFVMFWNSVKITVGVLAGQILVGVPAAWGFARYRFPGKNLLFMIYVALMMMPFQVMMLSNYLVLDQMKLLDHLWGIILPAAFSTFPVFIMYRFFESIPEALMESARLDGAGELLIFIRIGIPLGSAGIISALVLGFLEYWNLIEQPMAFLKTKSLWPLSLYLPQIDISQTGKAFAVSVLVLIPAVIVFLAGQDYLEQGIISTAIKE